MAHNISQRFRKEEKFSGKLGENISESFKNYDEACSDYALTDEQKLKYLHNFLTGKQTSSTDRTLNTLPTDIRLLLGNSC